MNGCTLTMNGPLCSTGAESAKPENTSELSHEVRTRDTPWRWRARPKHELAPYGVCSVNVCVGTTVCFR